MYRTHRLIKPGDHLVVLYKSEIEVIDTVISYLLAALERNEKCVYITGDADTDLIKSKLSILCDLKHYIDINQLVFLDKSETYSQSGTFVPDKMVKTLNMMGDKAIEEGFNGLAITGEISWVLEIEDGFEKIIEYEWKINEHVFNHERVSALCRYNMTKFSEEMIINIIELHPFIVLDNIVHENPFYIPSEGFKTQNIKAFQVEEMLKNIKEFEKKKSDFQDALDRKNKEILEIRDKLNNEMVQSLVSLLNEHDKYTKTHSNSVAELSKMICHKIGLGEVDTQEIYIAGLVHDIGKIIVPRHILNKKGRLSFEEMEIIKQHPNTAYSTLVKFESLSKIALIVKHHHERYDGLGYPDMIIGEDIPLGSRIISVVDSFDAMTNDRPYRRALEKEEAIKELIRNKGTQFDATIVDVFVSLISM